MCQIENRTFADLQVGEEDRLVHTLTSEDFSLLATQAATIGAGRTVPAPANVEISPRARGSALRNRPGRRAPCFSLITGENSPLSG